MTNIDKLTTYQHWWHSVVTSCDQLTTSCNQLRKTGCNWLNCTQLNCCNWFLAVELSCWGSQHSQQPVAVAVDQTFGQQLDPTGPQITIYNNCQNYAEIVFTEMLYTIDKFVSKDSDVCWEKLVLRTPSHRCNQNSMRFEISSPTRQQFANFTALLSKYNYPKRLIITAGKLETHITEVTSRKNLKPGNNIFSSQATIWHQAPANSSTSPLASSQV